MAYRLPLGNCGFLNWGWFIVGRRTVSVGEDVYWRLSRLAIERNLTLSDLIRELLDYYERGCRDSMIEVLDDVRAMLRECLSKLGVEQPAESKPEQTETVPKSEVVSGFEDNPWVQILRAKSRG
jgi:predicted CopG family antitoxin